MTALSPMPATLATFAPATAVAAPLAPLGAARRRRGMHAQARMAMSHAHQGAAALAPAQQQLPLRLGASFSISNSLLYPIAGAAVGALLLGLPGAIIGGVAGYLIAR